MTTSYISFDLEGTLVTSDFSNFIWNEGIPKLYAEKNCINLDEAKNFIFTNYSRVGEEVIDWYDIKYWFKIYFLYFFKIFF